MAFFIWFTTMVESSAPSKDQTLELFGGESKHFGCVAVRDPVHEMSPRQLAKHHSLQHHMMARPALRGVNTLEPNRRVVTLMPGHRVCSSCLCVSACMTYFCVVPQQELPSQGQKYHSSMSMWFNANVIMGHGLHASMPRTRAKSSIHSERIGADQSNWFQDCAVQALQNAHFSTVSGMEYLKLSCAWGSRKRAGLRHLAKGVPLSFGLHPNRLLAPGYTFPLNELCSPHC